MNVSSLKLSNIIAFLLFYYFIAYQQPFTWIVKGLSYVTIVLIVLGFYFAVKFVGIKIFFKESRNHLISILLLFVYLILDYGDFSKLIEQVGIYIGALAFFGIGLGFGYWNKFALIKKVFIASYIISIIYIIPYVFYSLSSGRIDKYAVLDVYGGEIYAYIMFWPFFLILLMGGFAFTYTNIFSKQVGFLKKIFFIFLFLMFVFSIVLSSFTAVLMMMLVIFMVFLLSLLAKDKAYKAVLLVPFMFVLLYYGVFFLSQSNGVISDDSRMKLTAILELGNTDTAQYTDEDLDEATGFRWQRIEFALDAFAASPYVGAGFYKNKGNTRITSNHSSVFDGFAKFGLFFLIFINLYISNIRKSVLLFYRTTIKEKKVFVAVILGSAISYFALSFFNPYLEFSTISILFLLFGWVRGQLNTIETSRGYIVENVN